MTNYYSGFDVSKGYADIVILNSRKEIVSPNFQLDDTFDGHCVLYQRLCDFFNDHPDATLYTAVESTGGYENNWFHTLVSFQGSLNIKTARLNPRGVNYNSKATMNRICTDKISAKNIAEYLITHPEKVSYQTNDPLASLRKQWGFITMLIKQRTQLLNQLESLVYSANTEILSYCKNGMSQWVLKLLAAYPTAKKLSKAKPQSVSKIPYITDSRAKKLIDAAKKSVASSCDEITETLIRDTVQEIIHLNKTIENQTNFMEKRYSIPEIDILTSFKGISDFSAIGFMLELQTVKRFSSVKKLASFWGVHPAFKISGDGVFGIRMSKEGRKVPRQILFMVALTAIHKNPLIKQIYSEHVNKGMNKMAAIGLCMHKILRIIYGMLKHNKKFDPEIDLKNRTKKVLVKKSLEDKNRRFQEFDSLAPISRRQALKRKERKLAHSDVTSLKAGSLLPL